MWKKANEPIWKGRRKDELVENVKFLLHKLSEKSQTRKPSSTFNRTRDQQASWKQLE